MKHVGRICVVNLFLLGASAFGAASPGMAGTPDAGEAIKPPPAPSSQDLPAVQMPQSPSGNPLWGIPITQLSATRDRPIFSPSRRPPPPAVASPVVAVATPVAKPKETDRPKLSLLGTIVNGDDGFGIFMDQVTAAALRIRIGADYQGWILRLVQARSATLQKGQDSMVLELPGPASNQNAVAGQLFAGTGARPPAPPPRQGSTTAQAPSPYLSPESASLRMPARPPRGSVRRQ